MDLAQQENKCQYCNGVGKFKRKFDMVLCDRHYRQLLKYGEIISTGHDPNNYYAIITTNKYTVKIDVEELVDVENINGEFVVITDMFLQ